MQIKGLTDEDFVNYKYPCMFIAMPTCSFKCEKECGIKVCQNSELALQPTHNIDISILVDRYANNPITKAIVFGGLEPFDSFDSIYEFIEFCRKKYVTDEKQVIDTESWVIRSIPVNIDDDIVIYTGYEEHEIQDKIERLKEFKNIIIKFGRYIPNQEKHYDPVLGVYLASDNQYAKQIS